MIIAPTPRSAISRCRRAIRARRSSTEIGLAVLVIEVSGAGAAAADAARGRKAKAAEPAAAVRNARRRMGGVPRVWPAGEPVRAAR